MSDNTKKIPLTEQAMRRFAQLAGLSEFSDEIINENARYYEDSKKMIKEACDNGAPSVKKPTKDTTGDLSYKEKSAPMGSKSGKKVISDDKQKLDEAEDPMEDDGLEDDVPSEPALDTEPGADPSGLDSDVSASDSVVDVDLMSLAGDLAQLFKKNFGADLGMTVNGREVPVASDVVDNIDSVDSLDSMDTAPEEDFSDDLSTDEPVVTEPEPERERFTESKKTSKVANMIYEAIMDKLKSKKVAKNVPKLKEVASNKKAVNKDPKKVGQKPPVKK